MKLPTAGAAAPWFGSAPPGCTFSAVDPIPMHLNDCADVLAPFVTELFNRSLSVGVFPMQFKAVFITPLLKKSDLDPSQGKSYRPILNLTVISKTL